MSRIRCFVAADLPEAVRDDLQALQRRLRARGLDARWAGTQALHLTVKFLGEVEPAVFRRVEDAWTCASWRRRTWICAPPSGPASFARTCSTGSTWSTSCSRRYASAGDDVVLLARTFAAQLAARYGQPEPRLTAEVRTSLVAHGWPGNVRKLRHAVERALLLSPPGEILVQELAPSGRPAGAPRSDTALPFPARLADVVHDPAQSAVALCDGNKSAAARLLGISRARLQRLLQREDTHDADAE